MKRLLIFCLILILAVTLAVPALAAEEEQELVTLDTPRDVVFWVSWDTETPEIVFLAPDGRVYDPTAEAADTTTILSGTDLYYVILNAPAGRWRVRFDKGANQKLDISVHDYNPGLTIETFTVGEVEGDRIPVDFRVAGADSQRYSYRVSAMIDHTGMEKELSSGSDTVGRDVGIRVPLNSLSTYSGYLLKLYVWYDDGGTDIFDFAFSDRFSYTNTAADQRAQDFALTVLPEEQVLIVAWPDLPWNAEQVLVAVFEDGAAEPAMFDEYDPKSTDSVQLAYDPAAERVDVEFTVRFNGVNTAPTRKGLSPAGFGLALPEGDSRNSAVISMTYTGFSRQPVDVTVNGYLTETVLDGDGTLNLTLGDDWNEILAEFTDDGGITWQLRRNIFVDRIPPVLSMSRSYDGMQVDGGTLTVSGTAMDCASVTVNGEAVTVGDGGLFSREIKLTEGSNLITVIAADALGNESRYTAAVYRGAGAQERTQGETGQSGPGSLLELLTGPGKYWVLLIVSVLCLMVVGYALIFWRREDHK